MPTWGDEYTGLEQIVSRGPGHGGMAVGAYEQMVGANYQIVGVTPSGQPIVAPAGGAGSPINVVMHPPSPGPTTPLGSLPYGGTPQVMQENPRNVRSYPVGFELLAVPAGSTQNITIRPQVLFRPRRLIVPSQTFGAGGIVQLAVYFSILDLKVGNQSQMVTSDPIPAIAFIETAIETALAFDTANLGHEITIVVKNLDGGAAHDFRALIHGAVMQ